MKSRNLQITLGAMILAIFAIILLMNRQTGGMFEETFMYILPIPMTAYASKFGWKPSLGVFAGMAFFSVLFGTFTTIFYAVSEALVGLVFGTCIHRKADMTKTLVLVMILSAVLNVVSTFALASVFGYDIAAEVREMQAQMQKATEWVSRQNPDAVIPTELFTLDYLKRMFVISMVFMGLLQGFIIFQLSLLILKRLRFDVEKPKQMSEYYPPKWTGAGAFVFCTFGTILVGASGAGETLRSVFQTAAICCSLYLQIFGLIAFVMVVRRYVSARIPVVVLLSIPAGLLFPQILMVLGAFYISGDLHNALMRTPVKK